MIKLYWKDGEREVVCNKVKILMQLRKKSLYCLKLIGESITVHLYYLAMNASGKQGGGCKMGG